MNADSRGDIKNSEITVPLHLQLIGSICFQNVNMHLLNSIHYSNGNHIFTKQIVQVTFNCRSLFFILKMSRICASPAVGPLWVFQALWAAICISALIGQQSAPFS